MKAVIKPAEIHRVTGIPYETILDAIAVGELPAVDGRKPGAPRPRWLVKRADYEEWLRKRSNQRRRE